MHFRWLPLFLLIQYLQTALVVDSLYVDVSTTSKRLTITTLKSYFEHCLYLFVEVNKAIQLNIN